MHVAFEKLRPEQREVLHLRLAANLSSRAVARLLGVSESAVQVMQKGALGALACHLSLQGGKEDI
jgi:DNA-directed RNA polymerase specialized sigma24 family protein